MQEKKINNLVINKVENQQTYEKMKTQGLINNDELYLVGGGAEVTSINGQTGDVTLTAEDVNALSKDAKIPSKTSDLTNDSDFATNSSVDGKLDGKVDKVTGKGLSTNDLTNALKGNYNAAYTHSTTAHAPSNAERNVIIGIQKNGTDVSVNNTTRKVNITVPTKVSELTNDSGYLTQHQDISGKVDKINGKGLSTNDYTTAEKTKLAGIAEGANNYSHPTYTAKSSGLYKITINDLGHVSATAAVTKADITDLGVPAQDTTYTLPVATSNVLGGVKSGGDFTVDSSTGVVTIKHQSLADYAKTADVNTSLNSKVPTTRKINNKALNADITLSVSDISGAVRYDIASQGLTTTQKANARTNIGAGTSSFSGNYNDLTNKPTIPSAITESTVSGWGFTKNTGTYSKPSDGIPKSDLASAIQTSLNRADTALQSLPNHTHNYAGSSSAGGAANSVKTNLTIKLNSGTTEGTNLFTFNGSAAKSINITPNSIGAAASDHTHSYLPLSGGTLTGNLTGNYITGTWLQTTATSDKAGRFATIDNNGWIYYRTASEVASDIGAMAASDFVAYTETEIQTMWNNISV